LKRSSVGEPSQFFDFIPLRKIRGCVIFFSTIGKSLARRLAQGEGGEEKILIFEQQIQAFLLGFAWSNSD
jgi:hypothetical protein